MPILFTFRICSDGITHVTTHATNDEVCVCKNFLKLKQTITEGSLKVIQVRSFSTHAKNV